MLAAQSHLDAFSNKSQMLLVAALLLYNLLCSVCETTVALVTRQGNPWGIRDWGDLTQPGLQV
jgi:ABC-type sulfate transport system substrate-binding protein